MTETEVFYYDPAANGYDLALDPRCLFGWGPPNCDHMFGHFCCRPLGHKGKCRDYLPGDDWDHFPCEQRQRPKHWDTTQRLAANDSPASPSPDKEESNQ